MQDEKINFPVFCSVMGLPIDAKTDWQAVCNAEALLCAPKTLRNDFRFIVSVLGENGINAPKATLQPLNTNQRQWIEPEQIPPLIAAAVGTPSAFPVLLALHSLRRSELLAVTWDDIDLAAGTIRVSGAVVQNEDHHFVTKETNKTALCRLSEISKCCNHFQYFASKNNILKQSSLAALLAVCLQSKSRSDLSGRLLLFLLSGRFGLIKTGFV